MLVKVHACGVCGTDLNFLRDYEDFAGHKNSLVSAHYYGDKTRAWSCGIGYSSPGSFFMDAAVRMTRYPTASFAPYYDYNTYDSAGNYGFVESPRIMTYRNLWNVAVTFGWRF